MSDSVGDARALGEEPKAVFRQFRRVVARELRGAVGQLHRSLSFPARQAASRTEAGTQPSHHLTAGSGPRRAPAAETYQKQS